MQDHPDDPNGGHDGTRSPGPFERQADRPHAGLPRIAAGGAVLARRAPTPNPAQAASGTPAGTQAPRSAATPTWPVLRPRPAVPGGPGREPPKVDTGTRPGQPGGPPPRVDTAARPRPAGPIPPRAPAKVDTGATPLETFDPMPAPTRHRPVMPIRPGTPGHAQARPGGPILPSADRVSAIRLARKSALGEDRDNGSLPMPGDEPTRTAKTVDAYRVRGDQLVKRYRRENEIPTDVDAFNPRDFAIWLLSLRGTLKPPSWRLYRQAALMVLGGMPGERAQEAMTLIEGDAPAEAQMGTGEPTAVPLAERLTSARKLKRFKYEDYVRLMHHLRIERRSKYAVILQDWLKAGIATGLRPIEWRATEVVRIEDPSHARGRRVFLLVLNAKATNGRSNGVVRTLDISAFSDGAVATVQRMSDQGLRAFREGTYREFQGQAAQILYEAGRKLWDRRRHHYSLYSCRHQFIANHKALGLANEEVSAMAGHRVDDTVAHNYARSRTAWSPDKITERARGVTEEIATVRKVLHIWEGRLESLRIIRKGVRLDDMEADDETTVPMADL